MRKCVECQQEKSISDFPLVRKGLYRTRCRPCHNERQKVSNRKWYKDKHKAYYQEWTKKESTILNRRAAFKRYYDKKSEVILHHINKRRSKTNTSWLKKEYVDQIKVIYKEAKEKNLVVDHIHPLSKGGLHVPWNLQLLTAEDNGKKANRTPDL